MYLQKFVVYVVPFLKRSNYVGKTVAGSLGQGLRGY